MTDDLVNENEECMYLARALGSSLYLILKSEMITGGSYSILQVTPTPDLSSNNCSTNTRYI